ncbi:MAG: GNAT family N-acetyltransferase [Oscillospiraceae bacterium]|nr:GNAT family N-acetyltransferase [Oscillospiraceae bacterium]
MKFEMIFDHPEHRATVAKWMYDEFCKTDRPSVSYEDMMKKLGSRTRNFPYTFLALEGDVPVGTVTLYENDLKGESLSPWMGSLVVAPELRGCGFGRELIAFIQGFARGLGYDTLYLRTEHTAKYYERLGWSFVKYTVDPAYDLETDVYQWNLED